MYYVNCKWAHYKCVTEKGDTMSDLFEKMEADAKAFSEVSEDQGSALANLVKAAQDADANIKYYKEQQNIAQKDYDQIIRELIPAAMDSMGLESVSVEGNSITLQPFVYARITEDNKDACFSYLRGRGLDDIIKNEVKVTFGKGEDNEAGAFLDDAVNKGLSVDNKKTIHPSTLKAVVKDEMSQGRMSEKDLEAFSVFSGIEAKIRRK